MCVCISIFLSVCVLNLFCSLQSQLLKKTSFLVDCLRDSGRHGNVMETLSSTAAILPAAVLCESREEGESGGSVEVIVEMWVRGKRELSERRPDSASTQRWKDRYNV